MKLSLASFVSTTTAASAAVEDASLRTGTASSEAAAIQDQKHRHDHHHVGNNRDQHQQQPPGLDNVTSTAVVSALLHNKEHNGSMDSRTTTTTGSGSGDGVTGDVNADVDVGLLPIRERHLDSVKEDCTLCTSSTVITDNGNAFKNLVSSCYNDASTCPDNVPIGCWNTSEVTDMASAFNFLGNFNDSINCWDTSRVTTMGSMFERAYDFNQPLDDWDVASVIDMRRMFYDAHSFNQPLNDWNVASVTTMGAMFIFTTVFNQPLEDWNVASVKTMYFMFRGAPGGTFGYAFNQPLDDWNVASVTNMKYMFYQATVFNQCLSSWADKTPYKVDVHDIFEYSGCPNQNTFSDYGPWCQGKDEQCIAPSATLSAKPKKKTKKGKK